jgi:hypothetical protein
MNPLAIEELLVSLTGMGAATESAAAGAAAAGGELNDLQRASNATTKAQKEHRLELEKSTKNIKDLWGAIKELQEGTQKYNTVINEAGNVVDVVASAFNVAGLALAPFTAGLSVAAGGLMSTIVGLGKVYTDFAQASLKQNDLLVKSYQSLSEFGSIDSTGLRGLLDNLEAVGTSPEKAQYFIDALSKAAPQLVMLGGTVAEGAKGVSNVVASLIKPGTDFERILTNLGYTTEDIMKYTTSYAAMNSRMMSNSAKDTEGLRKETMTYLTTLSELSELTGASRDQQKAAADELQKQFEFRAYIYELDKVDHARAVKENAMMTSLMVSDRQNALAMIDRLLNKGPTTGESAQRGIQVDDAVRKFNETARSNLTASQATAETIKVLGQGAANAYKLYKGSAGVGGVETQRLLGVGANTMDTMMLADSMKAAKAKEESDKMKGQGDEALNEIDKRKKAERVVSNYYNELYKAVSTYAVPAATEFAKAAVLAANVLKYAYGSDAAPILNKVDQNKVFGDYNKANDILDLNKEQAKVIQEQLEISRKKARLDEQIAKDTADGKTGFGAFRIRQERERLDRESADLEKKAKELADKKAREINSSIKPTSSTTTLSGLEGLRLKEGPGGALKPGAQVDPATARAAQEFAKLFPNYTQFNAFDDTYHSGKGGKHPAGRAFDVGVTGKPDEALLRDLKEKLKDFGVTNLKFEKKGVGGSTGDHIHVEVDPTQFKSKKVSEATPTYQDTKTADTNKVSNNTSSLGSSSDNVVALLAALNTKMETTNSILDRSLRTYNDIAENTKHTATALG